MIVFANFEYGLRSVSNVGVCDIRLQAKPLTIFVIERGNALTKSFTIMTIPVLCEEVKKFQI